MNFLKRDLKIIDKAVDNNPLALCLLSKNQYKYLLTIKKLYRQQQQMYDEKIHSIAQSIVSIHQSHIRPIVRGKEGRNVEFGAKINVSLQNNYAKINQFDFEAFNEGVYLKEHRSI